MQQDEIAEGPQDQNPELLGSERMRGASNICCEANMAKFLFEIVFIASSGQLQWNCDIRC